MLFYIVFLQWSLLTAHFARAANHLPLIDGLYRADAVLELYLLQNYVYRHVLPLEGTQLILCFLPCLFGVFL